MNRITNKPEPAATIMATDADFDVQNGDGLGVTGGHQITPNPLKSPPLGLSRPPHAPLTRPLTPSSAPASNSQCSSRAGSTGPGRTIRPGGVGAKPMRA